LRIFGSSDGCRLRMRLYNLSLLILTVLLVYTQISGCGAVESTLTIQPSTADTFVNSMYLQTKYPENPHGYLWAIFAGNMYVEYDSYKLYGSSRIYIKFNITSIPKDAKILSANMYLYMYDSPKTSQEFEAYRVLSDWGEHQLTWITQPPSADTQTTATTINPTPSEAWICWDITNDLKMWQSGAAENYGTMIKIKHEVNASDQLASFYPRQGNQPPRLKPKLLVRIDWYKPITPPSTSSPSPTETPTQTPPPKPPTQILPTNSNTSTTTLSNSIPEQTCATQSPATLTSITFMLMILIAGAVLVLKKRSRGANSAKDTPSGGSEPNNYTKRSRR
jgi:cell division septation protein DedD